MLQFWPLAWLLTKVQTVLYPSAKAILPRLTTCIVSKAENLGRFYEPPCKASNLTTLEKRNTGLGLFGLISYKGKRAPHGNYRPTLYIFRKVPSNWTMSTSNWHVTYSRSNAKNRYQRGQKWSTRAPFLTLHLVTPKDIANKRGEDSPERSSTIYKLSRRWVSPSPKYL